MAARVGLALALALAGGCAPVEPGRSGQHATEIDPASFCFEDWASQACANVKALARRSLVHGFLSGESLISPAGGLHEACATSEGCQELGSDHERARVQIGFEIALAAFEAELADGAP